MGFEINKHVDKRFDNDHCGQNCAGVLVFNHEVKKNPAFKFRVRHPIISRAAYLHRCSHSAGALTGSRTFFLNRVFAELGDNCTKYQGANTVASQAFQCVRCVLERKYDN